MGSKKLMALASCVLALALASQAPADLVGHWRLDDGSGTTAVDSSGNGHDGTLFGDPQWVAGVYGGALQFAGTPDKVDIPYSDQLNPEKFSMSLWANVDPSGTGHRAPISSRNDPPQQGYIIYAEPDNTWHFWTGPGWDNLAGPAVALGEWTHIAATYANEAKKLYVNGELVAEGTASVDLNTTRVLRIGSGANEIDGNYYFVGMIDDVAVFDHALTAAEVKTAMAGIGGAELAANPSPADEAIDVPRDALLGWEAGEFAATHDVYFGTVFDDVNDASRADDMGAMVSQNQTATAYVSEGVLEYGQTYYWRVDEVNAAPDNTIFKGGTWSFTVEPLAYPVVNVVATSNGVPQGGAVIESVVNGSGLNANGEHSVESSDMWLAMAAGDEPLTIDFEFDGVYKLHEMLIWNYNVQVELLLGFGLKDVTIEYSENGADWAVLGDATFNQATTKADYAANTTVDFSGVAAQYIKITVNSAYGGMGQYGLSEVSFLYIPVQAREPQPEDGAASIAVDADLSWRAGREGVSHEVYLSTDPNALELIDTTTTPTVEPGALELGATYYWQIDEVNEAEAISTWQGAVWSFSTQAFLVVDDFESYTDDIDAGEAIFLTWIDGYEVNGNGSTVGHMEAPFAETTIVKSGSQSMPLFYDNTSAPMSEAELALAQNWTTSGVQSLALSFQGAAGNTGQLYVKINGTKVVYDGDASDIARAAWLPWNIDLSAVGGNLASVTSLIVGVEGAGATGVVYIDDIRLYPNAPELITPVEPDAANLVARFTFDGNANDSSGNGYNGTINGAPTYVAGVDGQAINFNGTTDYVVVGSVGISGTASRTISGWAKADTLTIPDWCNIFGFTGATAANDLSFDMNKRGGENQYCIHVYGWEQNILEIDLEWHHLAATYDGTTIVSYSDGYLVGSTDRELNTDDIVHMGKRAHSEVMWPGSVDEVRIYNQALSAGEIASLAGKTAPLHKAF